MKNNNSEIIKIKVLIIAKLLQHTEPTIQRKYSYLYDKGETIMNQLNDTARNIRQRLEIGKKKDNPDKDVIKTLEENYKTIMRELK